MSEEREDKTIYKVVLNHEEQYSIWPADRENALGWNDAGKSGTKEECLTYIKEVGPTCARSACGRKWKANRFKRMSRSCLGLARRSRLARHARKPFKRFLVSELQVATGAQPAVRIRRSNSRTANEDYLRT